MILLRFLDTVLHGIFRSQSPVQRSHATDCCSTKDYFSESCTHPPHDDVFHDPWALGLIPCTSRDTRTGHVGKAFLHGTGSHI